MLDICYLTLEFIRHSESIYKDALLGQYEKIGRDRAEKIKLFIHWAKKNLDIKYV